MVVFLDGELSEWCVEYGTGARFVKRCCSSE